VTKEVTPERVLHRLLKVRSRKLDDMPNTVRVASVAMATISLFGVDDEEIDLRSHLSLVQERRRKVDDAIELLRTHWDSPNLEEVCSAHPGEFITFVSKRVECMECGSYM
jgi:hypothetical protein